MNCRRTLSKAIQSEINKISKSNFFERIHCIFALWVLQSAVLEQKVAFEDFIELYSNYPGIFSIPLRQMLWVSNMLSKIQRIQSKQI